jgi:hypothetical protein
MNYTKIEEYPLGDSDLREILGNNINIMSYPDLEKYNNIEDIFDDEGRCIILFLTIDETTGHWLCMHHDEEGIHYFDPYGKGVDKTKQWLSKNKLRELNEDKPLLMNLLKKSGKKVFYNSYDFQEDRKGINTCGRHCAVRLLYKDLDLNHYYNFIKKSKLYPDEFVALITFNIIKK